jgi:hypothetical protein
MAIPYIPLTDAEKLFHITSMVDDYYDPPITVSGILASGEANYYDQQQNPQTRIFIGNNYTHVVTIGSNPLNSIPVSNDETTLISPNNLLFNKSLSNSLETTEYEVYDFSTFEPYTHYIPKDSCQEYVLDPLGCAIFINYSNLIDIAISEYNAGS